MWCSDSSDDEEGKEEWESDEEKPSSYIAISVWLSYHVIGNVISLARYC